MVNSFSILSILAMSINAMLFLGRFILYSFKFLFPDIIGLGRFARSFIWGNFISGESLRGRGIFIGLLKLYNFALLCCLFVIYSDWKFSSICMKNLEFSIFWCG